MKAAICKKFGSPDYLSIDEVSQPTPGDSEVLVKVICTTVTSGDWRFLTMNVPFGFKTMLRFVFGFSAPRNPILGTEMSGVVERVGKSVSKFKVGDELVGISGVKFGCHAEYRCMHQDSTIFLKPKNLSFEAAAALPFGAVTAYDFLKNKAQVMPGQRVLVYGASGSVGSAAVQIAKHLGAVVTAVCSDRNKEFVQSLGADTVVDYTKENVWEKATTYDVILDALGSLSYSQCKGSLNPKGRLLLITASVPTMLQMLFLPLLSSKRILAGPASETHEVIRAVLDLATKGGIQAFVDRRFPLAQIKDAYRYVERRHKRGNVIIQVSSPA